LALAPNSGGALWAATVHSLNVGRWDDALKFALALQEVDPLHPDGYFWVNMVQQRRGRLAEAEASIRRALELTPTYAFGQFELGFTLLLRGERDAALTEFLKEEEDTGRFNGAAIAYFALGRKVDSDAALAQSLKRNVIFPSGIAAVHAYREEPDEAFKWLDRAFAEKDPILSRIKYSTEFDKLHGDSRYKAFLKKMNLPE
jgi:tetratricopeptide (TPR) repeat protein